MDADAPTGQPPHAHPAPPQPRQATVTDLQQLTRELRAEVRQHARALAELGVPPEVIVQEACAGIATAIRDHARSGR